MSNRTTVTEFMLRGFSDPPVLRRLSVGVFLSSCLFALLGNTAIVVAVTRDSRLHVPLYFFPRSLSFLDACYASVTVPEALAGSLGGSRVISFWGYVAPLFLSVTLCASESFLLTSTAYDRCVATLQPRLRGVTMSSKLCAKLVSAAGLSGAPCAAFHTANTFSLPFCGPNVVDHFFCDSSPIPRLACGDAHTREVLGFAVGGCIVLASWALAVVSYVLFISAIARVPSARGRRKAFSTCSSHLATVTLFYVTGSLTYLKPVAQYSPTQGRLLSALPPA
ncbi:olfactory receptor 5AP2-like [Ctenodactylus gundi]